MQQDVYDLLEDGALDGDARIRNLINSSLLQLGNDAADAALYESMLLDAATVLYRANAKAAVCAWSTIDKHAAARLEQLIDCSLVKAVSKEPWLLDGGKYTVRILWVHDVIKSILTRKANNKNTQCMTRVWLPDQVKSAVIECGERRNAAMCLVQMLRTH
jgi:hypothetical protein